MKIKKSRSDMSLWIEYRFMPENVNDAVLLNYIAGMFASDKRISDAQCKMHESIAKMHEANLELVKIKRSWVYRVLEFIKGNKNGYIQIYK